MKQHKKALALWIGSVLVLLVGALLAGSPGRTETVQEAMRDAVLHSVNRISLLGLKTVNPGMISAFVVTAALLLAAALHHPEVLLNCRHAARGINYHVKLPACWPARKVALSAGGSVRLYKLGQSAVKALESLRRNDSKAFLSFPETAGSHPSGSPGYSGCW